MKKLTAIFVCLVLVMALAIPALAAGTTVMTITTEVTSAKPGDEIEFKVEMSGGDECTSFGMLLEYDSKVFEVVEGKCTFDEALFKTFDKDKGLACVLQEAASVDDEVGTFVLKVKAGAPSGKTEVSGTSSVKNGSATVKSEVESVELTISGGASQSGGSLGNQSGSSSGEVQKPEIGEAETVSETDAAEEEETVAPEENQEAPEAPDAAQEEVPAAEAEQEEQPAASEPEVQTKGLPKDMIVIAVAGVVVLMAAVLVAVVLLKGRR